MDSSIITNTNKIDKHDKLENPFSSNESTNESNNEPLFEATFEDNFEDNFDNGDYDDHSVSLFGKELNDDKLNSYNIRNESKNNINSIKNAKPPRGGNAFSDSIFNNSNNNKNNNISINKNKDNINDQEDIFGYSKFDDDNNANEDAFNPKSPSIKITSPALNTVTLSSKFSNSVNAVNFSNDESGSFFTSHKYNNTKEGKEGKDKEKNDNTSNHSSQSTSKLNHSFHRLAKSLKKKPKQKKHILLDDDDDDDDDEDYKDEFAPAYSQIEEDDDDENEVLVNNENLSPPPTKSGHVRYPSDPQKADSVKMHQKTRSLSRFPEFMKKEFSSILGKIYLIYYYYFLRNKANFLFYFIYLYNIKKKKKRKQNKIICRTIPTRHKINN